MSELRDYILNKLEEKIDFSKKTIQGKAARATAADALKSVKSRFQKAGLAKKPGDAAKLTKQYSQETYKQRESLAAILADKLEELKQSTVDSAAAKRVAQVRSKDFRGQEKPVFKGGTGGTDKPEQIGTRSGAGKGVIGKRLSTLYKDKTTKGAATRKQESTNLKDRMVEILMEAFKGTSHTSVAAKMHNDPRHDDLTSKQIGKKSRALASVINKQPTVINNKKKAEAEYKEKMKQNRENPSRGNNVYTGGDSRGKTRSGSTFRHPVTGKDVEI